MTIRTPTLNGTWGENGQFQPIFECNLLESAARTATNTSDTFEMGARSMALLKLEITAVSGTNPTLDVVVQTSSDNSTWRNAFVFGQCTTTGSIEREIPHCNFYIRAVSTLGGTDPSFTYSLTGKVV